MAKTSVGPARRLRSKAQGRSGTQTKALANLQVQAIWYIFDHIPSFLCVILVTWFLFVFVHCFESHFFGAEVFSLLREARRSLLGALCLPDGIFIITFAVVFSADSTNPSWMFPCCDIYRTTGTSLRQAGRVTRSWWSWARLGARGAGSSSAQLPAAATTLTPPSAHAASRHPCHVYTTESAARNGWDPSRSALLFPKAPWYGVAER